MFKPATICLRKINDSPVDRHEIRSTKSGRSFGQISGRINMKRFLMMAIATLVAGVANGSPAIAQSQLLPTPIVEEVMVKTSLLTLNDANLTGNYTVMYAKMATPFRDKFSADTLKQAFTAFAGQHIDIIAAKPIVRSSEASINKSGALMLRGYFDTAPSRLNYELDFAVSEGVWKLINLDVKVREQSTAGAIDLLIHATTDFSAAGK
jgi:hypothetical protein